jgi:hypothetical protein
MMNNRIVVFFIGIFVGSLSGAVAALCVNRMVHKSISTEQLVIVDKSGKVRASLGTDAQERTSLDFFAPNNKRQLSLAVESNPRRDPGLPLGAQRHEPAWVPSIELDDISGRTSSLLTTSSYGNTVFAFWGADNDWHMGLGYIGDGSDDGTDQALWGLRARKDSAGTWIGVFSPKLSDGTEFAEPTLNQRRPAATHQ